MASPSVEGLHENRVGMDPSSHLYEPEAFLNTQPAVISVIDPLTYQVQVQNVASLNKVGEIAGSPCHQKLFGCETPCEFCRLGEALESDFIVSAEVELPGNQHRLVHWAKLSTKDGRAHVVETIVDTTERKRIEQAFRQSQKMEAVGRLAGGIAHDFNNLLMVVIGHAERLIQQFTALPARQELEMINKAGLRAAALTKKLLTFSRRQVFEPKEWPVNDAIRELEDLLQRMIGEHIQLVIVLHPLTGHAFVDPVQFEQVIMNLVLNARDAMPEGGLLNIETDNAELDEHFVGSHSGSTTGPYVKITVRDTGCGMDAETMGHIFEPFFSTKAPEKGTGLGLATVFGIIKQCRGYIDVESEPGKGARFTVYLPRVGQPISESVVSKKEPVPAVPQETILVVEDEESIRTLVSTILHDQGYHVLTAGDGIQALQSLQALKGQCRLVITDVMMPRMKSAVFAQGVRTMLPDASILFMSGYASDTLEANGVSEQGPFLQKPFLPSALIQKVRELLSPIPSR